MPSSALFSKQLCQLLLASKAAVLLAPLTRLLSIPAAANVPGFRGQDPAPPQMPMALGLTSPIRSRIVGLGCWQIERAGIRLPRANATILLANQRETKHEAERSCPERQKREWLHLWHHKVKYWYFKTLWCALVRI